MSPPTQLLELSLTHDFAGDESPKELFSLGSPRIGQVGAGKRGPALENSPPSLIWDLKRMLPCIDKSQNGSHTTHQPSQIMYVHYAFVSKGLLWASVVCTKDSLATSCMGQVGKSAKSVAGDSRDNGLQDGIEVWS